MAKFELITSFLWTIVVLVITMPATPLLAVYPHEPFPKDCTTLNGEKCVFPFKYGEKTYHECTFDKTDNGLPWCATSVANSTRVMTTSDDCDSTNYACQFNNICLTDLSGPKNGRGKKCQFPFKYDGVTYYNCAKWNWKTEHYGKHWCSTKTDRDGNHINGEGNLGFCGFCENTVCGCDYCPPYAFFTEAYARRTRG
eukprot:TRINITY_DN10368_c0_g1_i1.p1 TRINITY_DN10368_c0_g1~~TRINITY_DN10368_c0_g1_i1.p1  ORF type:complete len:197 (-),score=10.30 TRINITY_DN10368_c0_g1_i1:366-956(-)